MNTHQSQPAGERGYIFVSVIVLIGLGTLVAIGMLDSAKATAKTRAIVETRSNYYFDVERTLNSVVVWLQAHSKDLTGGFTTAEFESSYTLGDPTLASNEGEFFQTPTMVKVKGTNAAPMVSNNTFFGTSNFPPTKNIETNATFDPVASFQAANIGPANARVVMVWARDGADVYEPVFRIDVLTGNNPDRGVHSFSYVYTKAENDGSVPGFYGKLAFTTGSPNNQCSSYLWEHNGTNWTKGAARSNCTVGSDGTVSLKSKINGSAETLQEDGIVLNPRGGQADDYCEGAGCLASTMPNPGTWTAHCGSGPNLTVASNTTLATGSCYDTVQINNGKVLKLTDTSSAYWFKTLDFKGSAGNIDFGTIPVDQKIKIYVEQISGDKLNGNRLTNTSNANAPHQVEIYYLGTSTLTLNGTSAFNAVFFAPYAAMSINGDFTLNGGAIANQLSVGGNAQLAFVENLGTTAAVSDMNFTLRKASQRYR